MRYLVRGYSDTGVYSNVVEAASEDAALKKAKPILKKIAFRPIKEWRVDQE